MKFLNKINWGFLIFVMVFMASVMSVKAATLTYEKTELFYEKNDASDNYYAGTLKKFTIDGRNAYCIEPGVVPGTDQYNAGDWELSNIDKDVQKDITLYAYYGYDYPGHQTLNYRAATQALIWEKVQGNNTVVTFSTETKGGGEKVDVSTEKNAILALVRKHQDVPSFSESKNHVLLGKNIELKDANFNLEDFEVINNGGAKVSISREKIVITPQKIGTIKLQFRKKSSYQSNFVIYHADKYQDLISGGISYPVTFNVEVVTEGGKVALEKLDAETATNKAQGDASLKGAIYGLYNEANDLVATLTTNELGQAESEATLPFGKYYLQEIKASPGYELDKTKYDVMINETKKVTVQVKEQVIKKEFTFIKVLTNGKTGIMSSEPNVKFAIYRANGDLVGTYQTDAEGKFSVTLPYGHYVLKQLDSIEGYEKIQDYPFEVKEPGQETKVFADKEFTARLKIQKIDANTKEKLPLAHIKFKIYDVTWQKYLTQTISYPTAQTISVFETDANGVILTPYPLDCGTYWLEEVDEAIPGYLWNSEKLEFTINENSNFEYTKDYGAIINLEFPNYSVSGTILLYKEGEALEILDNQIVKQKHPLANVLFGLYAKTDIYDSLGRLKYAEGAKIGEYQTDERGFLRIENLPLGTYYVQELCTIDGYILDTMQYEVSLQYKDQYTAVVISELHLTNEKAQGQLKFLKIDGDTQKALAGVSIDIYTLDDKLIYSGTTDQDGLINLALPLGQYYLVETATLDGYELAPEKIPFAITKNDEVVEIKLENMKVPDTYKEAYDLTKYSFIFPLGLIYYVFKKKRAHI